MSLMHFPEEDLQELAFSGLGAAFDGYEVVEADHVVSAHKWRSEHTLVFKAGGQFWRMTYWHHQDEGCDDFEVEEVEPHTETVTKYRRVSKPE